MNDTIASPTNEDVTKNPAKPDVTGGMRVDVSDAAMMCAVVFAHLKDGVSEDDVSKMFTVEPGRASMAVDLSVLAASSSEAALVSQAYKIVGRKIRAAKSMRRGG